MAALPVFVTGPAPRPHLAAEIAARFPVLSFASGPANRMCGAGHRHVAAMGEMATPQQDLEALAAWLAAGLHKNGAIRW